jgi:hypothetical protein
MYTADKIMFEALLVGLLPCGVKEVDFGAAEGGEVRPVGALAAAGAFPEDGDEED